MRNHDLVRKLTRKPSCTLVTVGLGFGLGVTALLGGCDGGSTTQDMAVADMAVKTDLSVPDLAPGPDLLVPPDMQPPTAVGVPSGCPASATANEVYAIVQTKCAIANCHGTNSVHFQITSAADMKTKWVNKKADQADNSTLMPYVTPSDVNKSYVVYKLIGEQGKVSPYGGVTMPQGSAMLTSAQICTFTAWIKSGAN